jgi:thymidylate kinase
MIYIVEGCTCSGKSTFARNLAKILEYPLVHYPIPNTDFKYFEDYLRTILDYQDVVLDRFFHSEIVYQRAFDREVKLSNDRAKALEAILNYKKANAKIVFMNPPFESILNRFKLRGDDHVQDVIRLADVYTNYQKVMMETSLPVVEIVD